MFRITGNKIKKSSPEPKFEQATDLIAIEDCHTLQFDSNTTRVELCFQEDLMKIQGNIVMSEALSKFPIKDATATLKSGTLLPGDAVLAVKVIATSKSIAREAISYIINQIFSRLSIWEKHIISEDYFIWKNPKVDLSYKTGFQLDQLSAPHQGPLDTLPNKLPGSAI